MDDYRHDDCQLEGSATLDRVMQCNARLSEAKDKLSEANYKLSEANIHNLVGPYSEIGRSQSHVKQPARARLEKSLIIIFCGLVVPVSLGIFGASPFTSDTQHYLINFEWELLSEPEGVSSIHFPTFFAS